MSKTQLSAAQNIYKHHLDATERAKLREFMDAADTQANHIAQQMGAPSGNALVDADLPGYISPISDNQAHELRSRIGELESQLQLTKDMIQVDAFRQLLQESAGVAYAEKALDQHWRNARSFQLHLDTEAVNRQEPLRIAIFEIAKAVSFLQGTLGTREHIMLQEKIRSYSVPIIENGQPITLHEFLWLLVGRVNNLSQELGLNLRADAKVLGAIADAVHDASDGNGGDKLWQALLLNSQNDTVKNLMAVYDSLKGGNPTGMKEWRAVLRDRWAEIENEYPQKTPGLVRLKLLGDLGTHADAKSKWIPRGDLDETERAIFKSLQQAKNVSDYRSRLFKNRG